MKMRQPHIVPQFRHALPWLAERRPLTGCGGLLFPAMTDHSKPMSENTLSYAMSRMGYQGTATSHGFRVLKSTMLNEEGFDPDVIERLLVHAERNKVRAAKHRAEYLGAPENDAVVGGHCCLLIHNNPRRYSIRYFSASNFIISFFWFFVRPPKLFDILISSVIF